VKVIFVAIAAVGAVAYITVMFGIYSNVTLSTALATYAVTLG
jgi:hypothetical protein